VALLEPLIDTVIICSLTALVITLTMSDSGAIGSGISGVELTSAAMASVVPWFPIPLALVVMLFAFSTMIAWSYYGLEGWLYLTGDGPNMRRIYNLIFCLSVIVGCTAQLDAVLDFSDALVFAMALANVLALYVLAPVVKAELESYWARVRLGR
jgi:AGCS family alanine or glycine:cation symporter